MTAIDERWLRRRMHVWQGRLGLQRWDLTLRVEACEDEHSYMEVERSVYYERALILVAPWVLTGEQPDGVVDVELTPARVDAKVCHELLHLFTTGFRAILEDDLDGMLHRDVDTIVRATFRREEERMVDRLANALAGAFADFDPAA